MKFFISILLLGLLLSSCSSPDTKNENTEEVQDAKWKAYKNNFPEINLPYVIKTDSSLSFIPYKSIDTSYILKYLQPTNIPKEVSSIYRYIGRVAKDEYTLVLYAYEITGGIQGVRLASYNRKGNKTDEIILWSGEWLDNPAGKSISESILEEDGEIKITVWQYSSDEPTKEELNSTNPSRKSYYTFEDGRFTNSDETAVEK